MPSARVVRWWITKQGTTAVEIERETGARQSFTIDAATAERLSIAEGVCLSDGTLTLLEQAAQIIEYVRRLQRFMAHHRRSSGEIIKKLRSLGASSDDICGVLRYLSEHYMLDDELVARAYVRDWVRLRIMSATAIRRKLYAKGIPAEVADRVIAEEYPANDTDRAIVAARKALRRNQSQPLPVQYRRVRDTLRRLGYTSSVIRHVLNALYGTSAEEQ